MLKIEPFKIIANGENSGVEFKYVDTLSLSQTRDLLLPKLMSGEIRLHEAERVVEAVV